MNNKPSRTTIFKGNLSRLTQQQKTDIYNSICNRLRLNPASNNFKLLRLNDKEILYSRSPVIKQVTGLPQRNIQSEIANK